MSRSRSVLPVSIAIASVFAFALTSVAAQKLTPDDLVKRHVEQVFGSAAPEARRMATGSCRVSSLMGSGTIDGPFELASSTETSRWILRLGIPTYEGESISFDGSGVNVGFAQRRTSTRSGMGLFLSTYSAIVGDGLFGGVMNRRWPLRDLAARDTKLSYDGLKKLDGRELHRVRYRVNRSQGDLTVHLYFEPESFRHVASVYAASRGQDASSLGPTSQQPDERFTLTEKFGYEANEPSPKSWLVHYARTGSSSSEWKYECSVPSVTTGS